MPYLFLFLAVIAEVIATSALKASEEFSRLGPTLIVIIGYSFAFYMLTLVLRTMPVGVVYAIWAGAGVALITLAGAILYREIPDTAAVIGIGLIVSGVVVIKLFSRTSAG